MLPLNYADMQEGKIQNWGLPQITRLITWFQKEIPSCAEFALYIDKVSVVLV